MITFFFFCFKQTNLCNSLKYSFSLQRLKYININSTVCIKKKEKKNTHTCREHAQNTRVRTRYTETRKEYFSLTKGGIIIWISRNFCTVLLAKYKKIHSFKGHVFFFFFLDFTVNYVGKTVFIYYIQYVPISQIQTQKESLENYQMNIQLNLQ